MPDEFNLTIREREILRLLAHGYMNKQIALAMGVTQQVVKNNVSRILKKLGAVNRTDAIIKASHYGLVQLTA
jgi:DNA-binding NarL/FixJ family response regulator